ncbi:Oidioi.mRNA.OKI2018_I69.PAR.g8951.t1.cds [Oikopleura dioica]|uniref:Oidioi.mRNA.OKI2018_I69.PAR.g8951.t1.cds n=1 Tax=Oikopleura dioica TaxID=34765 RepID=A0ABN7RIB4_OIKDI|nr:Oidioi.mRNA.OKI2018_I69.PAR.g8951.t1.cds [Oikopleura dioica]
MSSWLKGAEINLEIPGVDSGTIITVIEYAYTGEIKLSNETVQSVLVAAQYLGCEQVITACFDFMECNLGSENVLDVLQLAEQISHPDLALRARQYIDRYFCDFYRLPEWKKARAAQVTIILASQTLLVDKEATVWSALKIWLMANPSCEAKLIHEMLSQVRLHLLSPQCLRDDVLTVDLISSNAQCRALIDSALNPHAKPSRKRKISEDRMVKICNESERQDLRWCSHLENDIYILTTYADALDSNFDMGAYNQWKHLVVKFDPNSKKCESMAPMESYRQNYGVAVLDGMIYALGGQDSKEVERFDPKTNEWEFVASMLCNRWYPACSVMNGRIYVFGGTLKDESSLNESYDPENNSWEEVPAMQVSRTAAAGTCFEGKIYITGGIHYSSQPEEVLDSMEVFDGKEWTTGPPMLSVRSDHGSLIYHRKLWIIGGDIGPAKIPDCEQFDFASQQWTRVQFLNFERSCLGVALSANRIFAFDGDNGRGDSFEIYDPKNGWSSSNYTNQRPQGIQVQVAAIPKNCASLRF